MPRWSFEYKITFGNLLTIVVTAVGLVWGYAALANTVANSAEAVRSIPAIQDRLTRVEVNQANGRQDRIDFQNATEATLEKIQTQQSMILQQTAGIIARLDESDKGRSRQ